MPDPDSILADYFFRASGDVKLITFLVHHNKINPSQHNPNPL